jgi:hypothetical protein
MARRRFMRCFRFVAATIAVILAPVLLQAQVVTPIPPVQSDSGLIAGKVLEGGL